MLENKNSSAFIVFCHSITEIEIQKGESNYINLFKRAHLPFDPSDQTIIVYYNNEYNLPQWEDLVQEGEIIFLISKPPHIDGLHSHDFVPLKKEEEIMA